jgi:hypothetical protein
MRLGDDCLLESPNTCVSSHLAVLNTAKYHHASMPIDDDFREQLSEVFRVAEAEGQPAVIVNAGDLHGAIGGYPRSNQQMPICCEVMREVMRDAMRHGDSVLLEPPKGDGASLTISYLLPRRTANSDA